MDLDVGSSALPVTESNFGGEKTSVAAREASAVTKELYESLTVNAESNLYTSLGGQKRTDRDQCRARKHGQDHELNVAGKKRTQRQWPHLPSVEEEQANVNRPTALSSSYMEAVGETRAASRIVLEHRQASFLVLAIGQLDNF